MSELRPRLWFFNRCMFLGILSAAAYLSPLGPHVNSHAWAQNPSDSGANDPANISGLQVALALENVITGVISRSEKSIVAIARIEPTLDDQQTPLNPDFVAHDFGTGVVIDRDGLILTQYHLVKDGQEHWVTTSQRKVYKAQPVAADPRSGLAVLRVPASDLTPITLGNGAQVRKGQFVLALGNPYAIARDGQMSASWGIVANISRKAGPLPDQDGNLVRKETLHHFGTLIQTDAKLNLGTSGGALLNLRGEMIGLTTNLAASAGYETSAGYAVPVDATFRRVVNTLKEGREVEYGLLGIHTEHLDAEEVRLGLRGMRVLMVHEETPASASKLMSRDVITHVNGTEIFGPDGLMLEVGKLSPEDTAELSVVRNGAALKIRTNLTKNFIPGKKIVTAKQPEWRGVKVDYSSALRDFGDRLLRGDVKFLECVVITEVKPDSPAWREGLREHMFIRQVGNANVTNPKEFFAAVEGKSGPVSIQLEGKDLPRPNRTIQPD